jgi:ATP-dependent DNA helicase DinG
MFDLVKKAFAPTGFLVEQGGRHTPEQGNYALSVAVTLLSQGKMNLSLLEAETGVGKSLGYLIPSLIWLAQNPKKQIVVSTFTRALQKQLIDEDAQKACQFLVASGLPAVKVAYRMGKASFFSIDRVALLIAEIQTEQNKALLHEFYQYALHSASHGSGLWRDWIDEHGQFPCDISPNSIGLIGDQTSIAYEAHLTASKEAQLLITNHATMLIAVSRKILDLDRVHAIIFDEAHELEAAAKSFLNTRLNFTELLSKTHGMDGHAAIADLLKQWTEDLSSHVNKSLINSEHPALMLQQQGNAEKLLDLLKGTLGKLSTKQRKADSGIELAELVERVGSWCAGAESTQRKAIAFSDKKSIPSLAMVSSAAAPFLRNLFEQLNSNVIMTSATLADMQPQTSFFNIKFSAGLRDFTICQERRYSPNQYGTMTFAVTEYEGGIFSGKSDDEADEVCYSAAWLKQTAETIMSSRGKTLVLVPSFREAKLLAGLLPKDQVICHQPNQPNYQVTQTLISGDSRILITPSCWEGVNIRNADGSQVLETIVISRIPYAPPDLVRLTALSNYLKDKSEANKIIHLMSRQAALRKVKQGIGRGIRSPNDRVHVVFCDPRIKAARHAIPKRFVAAFDLAVNKGKITNVF